MLLINILNGPRQGTVLELFSTASMLQIPIKLREDESVLFTTLLDEDLLNLTLVLHESEVPYSRHYEKDGQWVYEWHPRNIYNRKESFFHNYCGLAELSLVAKSTNVLDEFIFFERLNPIEVLAKKINAERMSAMLDFLAQQDGQDLASAIRITRIRAGYKEGGRTETFLLERIEHNLIFLKKILPAIGSRPVIKLDQVARLVAPNQETLIDERSLSWVTENPDSLYQASSPDESILTFDGEHFSASKIIESRTETSFDVYENQVLHGFVNTLISAAKHIQGKLRQCSKVQAPPSGDFEGYVSFFSQLNKLSVTINKNKIDKCTQLIAGLSRTLVWLKQNLPVKKVCLGIPHFTQKAKYNLLYQQVFNRTISWYRYGAPDWGFQEELNSIKDIPKLFEYYLLCVIKYHLANMGSQDFPVTREPENAQNDIFEYRWRSTHIRLMYEPDIWTVGHSRAHSKNLVNTEGCTVSQDKKISQRGSHGKYSNRCPDLIIEVSQEGQQSAYFIIDAKYTDSQKAFLDYLPELTMKYLHGIHQQDTGRNLSTALMIVNPDEYPSTRHFHHDDYNIYGKYPVIPALMVTSIDVSKSHHRNSNLRRDVSRVIDLIINHLDALN